MVEYKYAEGRIAESVQFILREMTEFEADYKNKTWEEYNHDVKLQKLIERTVENILTALIEVAGTAVAREGISAENYSEVMKEAGKLFKLSGTECIDLAKLAGQRNRLVHRYLDLKWQVITVYKQNIALIKKFLRLILDKQK